MSGQAPALRDAHDSFTQMLLTLPLSGPDLEHVSRVLTGSDAVNIARHPARTSQMFVAGYQPGIDAAQALGLLANGHLGEDEVRHVFETETRPELLTAAFHGSAGRLSPACLRMVAAAVGLPAADVASAADSDAQGLTRMISTALGLSAELWALAERHADLRDRDRAHELWRRQSPARFTTTQRVRANRAQSVRSQSPMQHSRRPPMPGGDYLDVALTQLRPEDVAFAAHWLMAQVDGDLAAWTLIAACAGGDPSTRQLRQISEAVLGPAARQETSTGVRSRFTIRRLGERKPQAAALPSTGLTVWLRLRQGVRAARFPTSVPSGSPTRGRLHPGGRT